MRILLATSGAYLPQRVGGSQLSIHDLCLALSSRGHQTAVLCTLRMDEQPPLDWTRVRNRVMARLGGRTHPCDRRWPYRVYRGYGATAGVKEVTRSFRPDVALVQSFKAVPIVEALLEEDVRTTLYFREIEFGRMGGAIPRDSRLRFVANSRFTASRVVKTFGIEPVVIHPLVRPAAYRTATPGRHVLFVNPVRQKGLETALELARVNPDIPFVFLESWPMPPRDIATLTERVRERPNVTFRRATFEMAREYAQAKLLLVPSVWEEAWGRVVTEAQLSGIPVIASAIGGLSESVGPGGVLVPPGSPVEAWNAALRELWSSPALCDRYRRLALEYSKREEIQPDVLLGRLLDVMADSVVGQS